MTVQRGNIRMLFDAIEEIELDAALERGAVVSDLWTTVTMAAATFFRPGDVIEITDASGKKTTAVVGETKLADNMGFTLNIIP